MTHHRSPAFAAALLVPLVVALTPAAQARLVIEHVDTSRFAADGSLVLYVDASRNSDGAVAPIAAFDRYALFIDNREVDGTFEVATLADSGGTLDVAVVVETHAAYAAGGPQGSVVALVTQGLRDLAPTLGRRDRLAVFQLDEDGVRPALSWSARWSDLEPTLTDLTRPRSGPHGVGPPLLYRGLEQVLETFPSDDKPTRRALLVVSDGVDGEPASTREAQVRALGDAAKRLAIPIHALGFAPDDPEPLVALGGVALASGGRYRELEAEQRQGLGAELARLGAGLVGQRVITFRARDYEGSARPVSLRLECTSDGSTDRSGVLDGVALGERPPTAEGERRRARANAKAAVKELLAQGACGCSSGAPDLSPLVAVLALIVRRVRATRRRSESWTWL
ncbi:MAG: hypothetical protein U1F43_00615 [Myxococcota bacterium]